MTIRFLTVAQSEFDEAFSWYMNLSPTLGDAFLLEAIKVFRLIEQYPQAWHPMTDRVRRCRLTRFPYGVLYTQEGDDQLVVAVAHLHQAPLYWRDRLQVGNTQI